VVRRSLALIAVATVAVVAIGFSAATLLSTVSPTSTGGDLGGNDSGSGLFDEIELEDTPQNGGETELPRSLELLMTVLLVLLFVGSLVYLVVARPQLLLTIALIALGGVVLWVLLQYFVWDGLDLFGGGGGVFGGGSGSVGTDQQADDTAPALPTVLAVLVGIGLLVVLVGYVGLSGRSDDADETDEGAEGNDARNIGLIAGDAADRIESGDGKTTDTDNEVYRAWREMTDQLDVESVETTTPREFQAAAVEAGMGPDDVRELTQLFEDVRYGGHSPTSDRERRAVDVLRRIEKKYGEEP